VRFAVALGAGLALHTAANMWNDCFDFAGGVDRKGGAEGSGVLTGGACTPGELWAWAWGFAAVAAAGGLFLAWQTGWGILALGVLGGAAAIGYSAGKRSPKRNRLGEAWAMLWMGAGMTAGGAMAQTGAFSWRAAGCGIPLALLTGLLMFTANWRDEEADRAAGVKTLVQWGKNRNEVLWTAYFWLGGAYAALGALTETGVMPPGARWGFASLPFAAAWMARLWRKGKADDRAVAGLGAVQLAFAVSVAGGLLAG
jgi:1,4-dihydroxy-2-naphthoate octaprenyltransferase